MSTVKRKWVPGYEQRLACGNNGKLYRHKKVDGTFRELPNDNPKKAIQLQTTHAPGVSTLKSFSYGYLVALTWVSEPPTHPQHKQHARVGYLDGDRTNTRPENLFWITPAKHTKAAIDQKKAQAYNTTRSRIMQGTDHGEFRSIVEAPDYFVKDDGTLWRLKPDGDLKRIHGHLDTPGRRVTVKLAPYFPGLIVLHEIVAALYLPKRPGPFYRALSVNGNHGDTSPENLVWDYRHGAKPYPHKFTAGNAKTRHATKRENDKAAFFDTVGILRDQGARQLENNLDIWAHPQGKILRIDRETGIAHEIIPDEHGRFHFQGGFNVSHAELGERKARKRHKAATSSTLRIHPSTVERIYSTRGHNALDFIADAFPDLMDRNRLPFQHCRPKDYNWQNLHPSNIAYSAPTNALTRVWYFVGPKKREPLYGQNQVETTANPQPTTQNSNTSYHVEHDTLHNPHTNQEDTFSFDL